MKHSIRHLLLGLGLLSTFNLQLSTALAQSTAFTYQGRLNDSGQPATGIYDFRCQLYDAGQFGALVSATVTNAAVPVTNGLVVLNLDFGAAPFTGAERWLHIGVRSNGALNFAILTPRQRLAPTPYAITASHLTGTLPASQLSGTIPSVSLAGTYTGALTFDNAANSFSGNGAGLTVLNASQLASGTVPAAALGNAWKMAGNAGTTPGADFLGTTDDQALELKVKNWRGLRLEPAPEDGLHSGIVNVVSGSPANSVAPGVFGATIAGGGAVYHQGTDSTNRVAAMSLSSVSVIANALRLRNPKI